MTEKNIKQYIFKRGNAYETQETVQGTNRYEPNGNIGVCTYLSDIDISVIKDMLHHAEAYDGKN